VEIRLDPGSQATARLACPGEAIPRPGQYALAWETDSLLPLSLFTAGASEGGFLAAPPIPTSWPPGTQLQLAGPLGRGFDLPAQIQRLALISLGESVSRLLPLGLTAMESDIAVTLFSDGPLPPLPPSLEAYPLSVTAEALSWADFLALDMPLESVPSWRRSVGLPPGSMASISGQALITAPMPCGGLAECGVCAFPHHRSWKLTCKDGPVFNLKELD
jgi:hypothetical protein